MPNKLDDRFIDTNIFALSDLSNVPSNILNSLKTILPPPDVSVDVTNETLSFNFDYTTIQDKTVTLFLEIYQDSTYQTLLTTLYYPNITTTQYTLPLTTLIVDSLNNGVTLQPSTQYFSKAYVIVYPFNSYGTEFSFSTPANQPPSIDSISWNTTEFHDNSTYTLTITATDPDNDPLSYQVQSDDPDVTIVQDQVNPNVFSITFPDYNTDTLVSFTVYVTDSYGFTVSQTTEVLVKNYNILSIIPVRLTNLSVDNNRVLVVGGHKPGTINEHAILMEVDTSLTPTNNIIVGDTVNDRPEYFNSIITTINGIYCCGTYYNGSYYQPYVAKFDNTLAVQTQTSQLEDAVFYDLATDSTGNIYVCGSERGDTLRVTKYDANLNKLIDITIGSAIFPSSFYTIKIDQSDNIYVAGTYSNKIYIAKLDTSLNILSQANITTGNGIIYDMYIDQNNDIYLVGSYDDGVNGSVAFIAKLTSSFSLLSHITFPTISEPLFGVGIDQSTGNIISIGGPDVNNNIYILLLDNTFNAVKQLAITVNSGGISGRLVIDGNLIYSVIDIDTNITGILKIDTGLNIPDGTYSCGTYSITTLTTTPTTLSTAITVSSGTLTSSNNVATVVTPTFNTLTDSITNTLCIF